MYGRVLVTGGSGFLGRAILRRAKVEAWPAEIIVYSRDELKQAQCKRKYPNARYVLGDVRDTDRLALVAGGCDTIIHAGALKYVPEAEYNVSECISVNVGGTLSVFAAARRSDVKQVVFISTDKAVAPTNVYGMTKALGERLVSESAGIFGLPNITAVRYGNVIGSTGSVVPEFQRQMRELGEVNITDGCMTRFWMPVDSAIELILMAMAGTAGSVYIPVPKAMSLSALVEAVVPKAKQNVIGLRPGEKMHEVLITEAESPFSSMYDSTHELPALSHRKVCGVSFELSSQYVEEMSADEFMTAVEDAQYV